MTKTEIYNLMLRCNSAQLTAVTVQVGLNAAYLPDAGAPAAVRASEILNLTAQSNRLAVLEAALLEFFPQAPVIGHAAAEKKAKHILILAANPVETDRLED